jgi:uncharacterized protein YycO
MAIPLDPGAGGRSITADALQVGDIIVSTTTAFDSGVIRFATKSQVSHSAIYIGEGQVVEAIGQGVTLRSLDASLAGDSLAVAYRVPGLTKEQATKVRDYLGRNLDRPYSVLKAINAGFARDSRRSPLTNAYVCAKAGICYTEPPAKIYKADVVDSFFCSELVFSAFQEAGIPLTGGRADGITPADLQELWLSKVLVYVGHLKSN